MHTRLFQDRLWVRVRGGSIASACTIHLSPRFIIIQVSTNNRVTRHRAAFAGARRVWRLAEFNWASLLPGTHLRGWALSLLRCVQDNFVAASPGRSERQLGGRHHMSVPGSRMSGRATGGRGGGTDPPTGPLLVDAAWKNGWGPRLKSRHLPRPPRLAADPLARNYFARATNTTPRRLLARSMNCCLQIRQRNWWNDAGMQLMEFFPLCLFFFF